MDARSLQPVDHGLRSFRRILGAALAAALLLPAATLGVAWLWLRGSLPETQGSVAVPALDAPVEVIRDENAVPHIFAASAEDAYFALGWLHAQDRLFQMEMQRRAGAGRLAEAVGEAGLRLDRYMRTLGIYRHAERSYEALSPEVKASLDAYAAGVSAWLDRRTGPLPIEFQILGIDPEPWRPADTIVWGKLMALQLTGNSRQEMLRARLLQRLSPEQVETLFPAYPGDAPRTVASLPPGIDFERWASVALPELGPPRASNEWVVSGEHTPTGKPVLANDPHLGMAAPILWYLARIEAPGLSLTGATAPGVPYHVFGHNGTIAWGITTTGTDVQDLYVERIDPADPSRYVTPGGSEPFATREEVIRVKGGGEERITVRTTRHGPVISDVEENAAGIAPEGHVLALAFTALDDEDTTARTFHQLNRARDWDGFRSALSHFKVPQQNFVFADTAGNIGFLAPGRIPIRAQGQGLVPVPGWTDDHDWTGHIPFDQLPQALNPPSGRIVNANNRITPPDYPWLLTTDWEDPHRARRIEEVLDAGGPHGVAEAEALLADKVDLAARELLPVMTAIRPSDPRLSEALRMLGAWDAAMSRERPEPLIFQTWLRELNRELYADELGPLFNDAWNLAPRRVSLMLGPESAWCDDVGTRDRAETCAEALESSLRRSLDELSGRYGRDMRAWRWGSEHRAPLAHQLISRIPVLRDLFDIGIETDGSFHTVNRGASRISDERAPFAHQHGAGYRAIYDLADLSRSRFIITTGQSGNPLSPHYGDFVERWRDGRHVELAADRDTLAATGRHRLVLTPEEE